MATHSSIFAWKIPWTEEPGGPQSLWSQKSDTTEMTEHAGSIAVALALSCPEACGIFPGQGSKLCPLHWQADS